MTAAASCILMVLMAASAPMPSDSGLSMELVPGVGAGPVTLSASREELASIFADSVLEDTPIHMGEGYYSPGTEVMAGTDLHLSVVWSDEEASKPRRITALGPGWTAPEGVRVGMTLQEVEELAGPFLIAGFGWDYGGAADMAGTPLQGLLLRFRPPDGAELAEAEVMGGCFFDSGHPGMQSVNPVLESISVLSEEG